MTFFADEIWPDAFDSSILIAREVFMEDQVPGASSAPAANSQSSGIQHEDRSVWVLTAYGISGLALFGVLAYYFSDFVSH